MTQAIDKTSVDRLCELHKEIIGSAVKTIRAAIEAGEILSEIKASLLHGEFTSWCEVNLPFDIRTAQRYMRCYEKRDRLLKNDRLSLLTRAYRALEERGEGSSIREVQPQREARKVTPTEWMQSILRHEEEVCQKSKKVESVVNQFMFTGQAFMYFDLIVDILSISDDVIEGKISLPVNFIHELRRKGWDKNEEAAGFLYQTVLDAVEETRANREAETR